MAPLCASFQHAGGEGGCPHYMMHVMHRIDCPISFQHAGGEGQAGGEAERESGGVQ